LENKEILNTFLISLETLLDSYKTQYERKIMVIGVSCMIASDKLPQSVYSSLQTIIKVMIKVLSKQYKYESKSMRKLGNKELKED